MNLREFYAWPEHEFRHRRHGEFSWSPWELVVGEFVVTPFTFAANGETFELAFVEVEVREVKAALS